MGTWKPGKQGVAMEMTEATLNWIHQTLEDVWNNAGEEDELNNLIDEKQGKTFLKHLHGSASGWKPESDAYGDKMYKEREFGSQANGTPIKYRISVVVRPKGNMQVDIRQWYLDDLS